MITSAFSLVLDQSEDKKTNLIVEDELFGGQLTLYLLHFQESYNKKAKKIKIANSLSFHCHFDSFILGYSLHYTIVSGLLL
jgi:hypothetical protein